MEHRTGGHHLHADHLLAITVFLTGIISGKSSLQYCRCGVLRAGIEFHG